MATTQRAYTLRLDGINPDDGSWREALWLTHEAVNNGAKVFGDWLLTMRGGLDHRLADAKTITKKETRNPTVEERKARRILLALSWLSVESELGAPKEYVVASGLEDTSTRNAKVMAAFVEILKSKGLSKTAIEEWERDCSASLSAAIRKDAVWVNRSKAFDDVSKRLKGSIGQKEIWDFLEPFFGNPETYLSLTHTSKNESSEEVQTEAEKDLVQKAGQWLSSRFGTGKGADFSSMEKAYGIIAAWAKKNANDLGRVEAVNSLGHELSSNGFSLVSHDFSSICALLSGPGYKSATRNLLKKFDEKDVITSEELAVLGEKAEDDAKKCRSKTGLKGSRPYADEILKDVEEACGFTYLTDEKGRNVSISNRRNYPADHQWGAARHKEFAVMLDHAARRVSALHAWIKRAEANRAKFEEDAGKIEYVPEPIRKWLDDFCETRGEETGALEPYRIRRRAIDGWEEIVTAWGKSACETSEDRIAEARRLQDELEKFGDIQLFEALAAEEALCVWHEHGDPQQAPTPEPLINYVSAIDAEFRKRRFKVPSYRHPHPLLHPVFCDFGNSRWTIDYSLLKAAREIDKLEEQVKKKRDAVKKAEEALEKCADKDDKKESAAKKLEKARVDLEKAERELDFLASPNKVSMMLWTGKGIEEVRVRWRSKRMRRDLAVMSEASSQGSINVSRADRLGRAASGAQCGDSVQIAGLYEQKTWNGRLQAPRDQLERLARHVEKHGWDEKAQKLKGQIKWLLTFSAKLQPQGPWVRYAQEHGLNVNLKDRPENRNRGEDAKLILCRLPGLRVLSVDLGHRYAAACAVWESLSKSAFKKEIRGRKIVYGGAGKRDMFCHTKHQDENGNDHVTIYRRIAADNLPDGEEHPAPWARLDRQFLIKLQGEDDCARLASVEEIWQVHKMEEALGRSIPLIDRLFKAGWGHTDKQKERLKRLRELGWQPASTSEDTITEAIEDDTFGYKPSLSVDELMANAVRVMRLALKRHGDRARIAYAMTAEYKTLPGGRAYYFYEEKEDSTSIGESGRYEERINFLQDALVRWHGLFSSPRWKDDWARELWDKHIARLPGYITPPEASDSPSSDAIRSNEKKTREVLRAAAEALESKEKLRASLHKAWAEKWKEDDEAMEKHLRYLKDWLHPRGNNGKNAAIFHTGGLSLLRLATMTEFRRKVQVGFFTRLHPDGTRAEIGEEFGRKGLDDLERMREQRVKQLASRIVEAALGIGSENRSHWEGGKRPRGPLNDPRFSPCHAVVIESLSHYRPDETRTRRENRQLMTWSASRVKKYLADECLLYGLHLREVSASYTSRQDSRTGAPGIRCSDIPVDNFMRSPYWRKEVKKAEERQSGNKGDARDKYLCEINTKWTDKPPHEWKLAGNIRIPIRGGDIFVSADRKSPAAKGIQADLNAAANIGLRALLDPDWPGKWWYVRCDSSTHEPLQERVKGSKAIDASVSLTAVPKNEAGGDNVKKPAKQRMEKKSRGVINLWRDISTMPVTPENGPWHDYSAYWNQAQSRVVNILRKSI